MFELLFIKQLNKYFVQIYYASCLESYFKFIDQIKKYILTCRDQIFAGLVVTMA